MIEGHPLQESRQPGVFFVFFWAEVLSEPRQLLIGRHSSKRRILSKDKLTWESVRRGYERCEHSRAWIYSLLTTTSTSPSLRTSVPCNVRLSGEWMGRINVSLAFNHKIAPGTRGVRLIKQLWLAKFLAAVTNHRQLSYEFQTCWSLQKKKKTYHRVSFYDSLPQSKRLNNAILLWKEPRASQNSPCLSAAVSCLIESYRPGRKSLSAPERAELGSPGCQRRWNVKPLTCILTLCHFDKSGWRSLSADWEWRRRSSWILNAGRQGWKKRTENNFYSTGGSETAGICARMCLRGS